MNNETKVKNKNQNSGITLIALVVTIVVLIILATVSINAVFSENGIIKKAELAKSMHANAIKADEESMNTLLDEYNNAISDNSTLEIITFTLEGYTFYAESGMTWRIWCDSKYSPGSFTCDRFGVQFKLDGVTPGYVGYADDGDDVFVKVDDLVQSRVYYRTGE